MSSSTRALLALALFVFVAPSIARADSAAREYDVKGALLFNLAQFVEWPTNSLPATNAPFVIGILGTDPFGKFLDEFVRNERAHGRPIEIRRCSRIEQAAGAQILFISKSEQQRLDSILASLGGKAVLTVSDAGGRAFARRGGMVAFVSEGNSIKLCINLDAARSAGLAISAKVLQLAEIASTQKE